jgi:DNA-binding MarR family transcriptional regulator
MPKARGQQTRGKNELRIPHTITRQDYFRDGTDEWFREAIYTCVRGLRALQACREVFAQVLRITGSQFAVLMGIAYRQGREGVSIGEVARHVALGPTHVTTEISRLIRAGLVVKRPNPKDGRSVLVSLTPNGESAVLTVTPLVREVNDALFQDIDAAAVQVLAHAMKSISINGDRVMAELGWRMKNSLPFLAHAEKQAHSRPKAGARNKRAIF